MLSDDEVICTFMEARPVDQPDRTLENWAKSEGGWWQFKWSHFWEGYRAHPTDLTLDVIHEVEERLTPEQRAEYCKAMLQSPFTERRKWSWEMLHADAPARIKALASILRPIVESK